jgi:glycosyltransferase family protein
MSIKNEIHKIINRFKSQKWHEDVKVYDYQDTLNLLKSGKNSLCRLGDGELAIILGKSLKFQKYDDKLRQRLIDILFEDNKNIHTTIPYTYFRKSNVKLLEFVNKFLRKYKIYNLPKLKKYLNFNKEYYDTAFSQMYVSTEGLDCEKYFSDVRSIWKDKDICLIKGKGITLEHKYDILDNVKSIEVVDGPSKHAFSEYNEILNNAKKIKKDKLVLIILGPTATVLAYDLAQEGYHVIDIGHIAKDYDYFKQNKSITPGFFTS